MASLSYRSEGKSILPLTRVQKILKADKELPAVAKEAAFLISIATEEFIKKWSVACHKQAQRDERVTLRAQDLAVTVRFEEFMFLDELILSSTDPVVETITKPKPHRASRKDKDGSTVKDAPKTKGRSKGKEKEMPPPFAYSNAGGSATALPPGFVATQTTLNNMFNQGATGAAPQFRPAIFTSSLPVQPVPHISNQLHSLDAESELLELSDNDEELELKKQLSAGRRSNTDETGRVLHPLQNLEELEESRDETQTQNSGNADEIAEDDVEMKFQERDENNGEDIDMT